MSVQIERLQEEDIALEEDQEKVYRLIVYNDDINTFDHVIETLIKVCKHEVIQAEQCTYIVHYKGKCAVKHGSHEEMKLMKDQIISRGITATVER